MPETRIYSLHLPDRDDSGFRKGEHSIVINVSSPGHLKQPYIVFRDSPYRLKISGYSKWEASPRKMLGEKLRDIFLSSGLFKEIRISKIVPPGFLTLDVHLRRFERFDTQNGSFGDLGFDLILTSPAGNELYSGRISKRVKLDSKDFLALAKGLSTALAEGLEDARKGIVNALTVK
jgi:hypothetical protein